MLVSITFDPVILAINIIKEKNICLVRTHKMRRTLVFEY